MDAKAGLLDKGTWPGGRDELLLTEHLASTDDQGDEQVKSAAPKPHRLTRLQRLSLFREELKRPEGERDSVHITGPSENAGKRDGGSTLRRGMAV